MTSRTVSRSAVVAHALLDQRPAGLQLAVGQPSTLGSTPKPALTPSMSIVDSSVVEAELAAEALAVALGEHHRDVGDLGEDVEVGRQPGDRPVEEHQVLDVEHQLLGHPRAVAEQRLDDALHLA